MATIDHSKNKSAPSSNPKTQRVGFSGHPDYGQCLDALGALLPRECRVNRVPYAESYCCSSLACGNLVFGRHRGMSVSLYVPTSTHGNIEDAFVRWVDVTRMGWEKQKELVFLAYEYASALALKSPANKSLVLCPSCAQKLRAPNHLGPLNLTCPQCKHSWRWSPEMHSSR